MFIFNLNVVFTTDFLKMAPIRVRFSHRWASASRKLTPALAFRHPSSKSGTGPLKCRTASLYSGTGQVPASLFFSSPVPDHLDVGQSGIPVVLVVHI
jgi:hypothetical protein